MKDKIIEILNKYTTDDSGWGGTHKGVEPKDYVDIAEEILMLNKIDLLKISYRCQNVGCVREGTCVELHQGEEPMNEEYWYCPNCGEEYKKWYYETRAEFSKQISQILTPVK